MRNFHRIVSGYNLTMLNEQLARHGELWDRDTLRTTHPGTPHTQVSDIWLRFNDLEPLRVLAPDDAQRALLDQHESINYPAFAKLPAARSVIFDLMRLVEGERLGRVLITRLAPGKAIAPHVDGGDHAAYYSRYHVALAVYPGVVFRCGDEFAPMVTGDIWWFNNGLEHEVVNNSAEDRLTMIVDIRTLK